MRATALLAWVGLAGLSGDGGTTGSPAAQTRVVTLVSAQHPRHVTLEWRRIEGGATVRIDARQVTLAERTPIATGDEECVLRVLEPGAAPRSFLVPAGTVTPSFDLAPPVPGGEVFGRVPRQRFRPQAVRLVGPGTSVEAPRDDGGVFAASGLSPGAYTLVPVYRGGVAGRDVRVVVHAGQTVDLLALDLPDTGAVRIDLADSLCGESDLRLHLRNAPWAGGGHSRAIASGACAIEMEGLEPGSWRVAVTRGGARNEPRGSAEFEVAAGEAVEVPVEPVVRVAGTVTAGGAPAAGLRLTFEQAAAQWNVVTNDRGAYEVMLGPPGEYVVSILAAKDLPSRSFRKTFGRGDHQEDLELGPGAIEVSVRAEAAGVDESVELALLETGGRRLSGRFDLRDGGATFSGLDYGEYTVTGTTASGLRSRNHARVELTAESPSAQVELLLGRGRGSLRVVGSDGVALAGARATAGQASLREWMPGVFDLSGVPAGERLVAHAPDHAPACRVLYTDASSDVVVPLPAADGAFTLRVPADASWRDALITGLTGSDCPLAVDDLEPQVRTEHHLVSIVLNLPRGSFGIVLGGQVHAAEAPGELDLP